MRLYQVILITILMVTAPFLGSVEIAARVLHPNHFSRLDKFEPLTEAVQLNLATN